jgi:Ca2+-transporting ATPase
VGLIIGATIIISASLLYIEPLSNFFEFHRLNLPQLAISLLIGFVSVIWFEGVKWWKRTTATA